MSFYTEGLKLRRQKSRQIVTDLGLDADAIFSFKQNYLNVYSLMLNDHSIKSRLDAIRLYNQYTEHQYNMAVVSMMLTKYTDAPRSVATQEEYDEWFRRKHTMQYGARALSDSLPRERRL